MASSDIRVYKPNEIVFTKLTAFINMVNNRLSSDHPGLSEKYALNMRELLFDAGQDWSYTAVTRINLMERKDSCLYECHALCPRDYEFLVNCDSFDKISILADRFIEHLNDITSKGALCVGLE